jgi:hypothetical protein
MLLAVDCCPPPYACMALLQHRNGSMLTDFLVNDVIGHKTLGMGSPYVDGFYIDDTVRRTD